MAVAVLTSTELESNDYLKTWMLARLLAWMILDQPRKRRRSKKTGRRRIRRANANQIGIVVLGAIIDLGFRNAGFAEATADKSMVRLFILFVICKGFAGLQNRGGRAILSHMKQKDRELQCVLRIIDYMCRFANQHSERDSNFTIESAKKFVEKFYEEDQMGPSRISKIWEKYKHASPYIFGASDLLERLEKISTIDDLLRALRQVTDTDMKSIISRAAYAADLLGRKPRDIPKSHFKDVERAAPRASGKATCCGYHGRHTTAKRSSCSKARLAAGL
jgi:hypothetical protein